MYLHTSGYGMDAKLLAPFIFKRKTLFKVKKIKWCFICKSEENVQSEGISAIPNTIYKLLISSYSYLNNINKDQFGNELKEIISRLPFYPL